MLEKSLKTEAPLEIEFLEGSRIQEETVEESPLPVFRNGPPGTFVILPSGERISVPTDQIVLQDESDGVARLGFGGMSFEGMEEEKFVFWRVHDLWPEEKLSPERGLKMTLKPEMIKSIRVQGTQVWPR